ncbi:MAG: OsmC family protein [Deltaproteobacteria bacterium]|nr:OsmC family protein [Deltaproteobacteria bacterium]
MMGTLAGVLATKKIRTHTDRFLCRAEGDIEDVGGLLKITRIRVHHTLKVSPEEEEDARWAFGHYLERCPAAQSVIGCIQIDHDLALERA